MNIRLLTLLLLACWCRAAAPIIQTPARGIVVSSAVQPFFVAAGTMAADGNAAGGWNATPALPTGWQENDIHILTVATKADSTFSVPAGWNLLDSVTITGLDIEWHYRRAQSGDTDPACSVSAGGSGVFVAVVIGYRGCTTSGLPFDDDTTTNGTDDNPNAAVAGSSTDLGRAICVMGTIDDLAWSAAPPPAGWNTRDDQATNVGTDFRVTTIDLTATVDNGETTSADQIGTLGASQAWASCTIILTP